MNRKQEATVIMLHSVTVPEQIMSIYYFKLYFLVLKQPLEFTYYYYI